MHIDLHMHSYESDDGEYQPEKLVSMAKEKNIDVIAITDHNRVSGVEAALAAGGKNSVQIVPGIELDGRVGGRGVHVLGYFIDYRDSRFSDVQQRVDAMEREAGQTRLDLVEKLGIAIDRDKVAALSKHGLVPGELLAEVALADPRNRDVSILAPYRQGGARSDNPYLNFYSDYCAEGKAAYCHVGHMPLAEAVELIVSSGGAAVLAHPGVNLKGRETLLEEIVAAGVKGIEAYSSYHSGEERRYWCDKAKRYGLFVTCGSDFHGKTKPAVAMGGHGCEEEETVWAALDVAR